MWPIKGREEHSTLFDTTIFKNVTKDVPGERVYSDGIKAHDGFAHPLVESGLKVHAQGFALARLVHSHGESVLIEHPVLRGFRKDVAKSVARVIVAVQGVEFLAVSIRESERMEV